MNLFNGFFWQDPSATDEDRIVTESVSVPVADIHSVQVLEEEDYWEIPQRLRIVVASGLDPTLYGEEARSFLEQLEKRDGRYERMVRKWDLELGHS